MILYVEETLTHFESVSIRRLAQLGGDGDELHARAMESLPSRTPKIDLHGSFPKRMLVAGRSFEATLLLYITDKK